VAKDAGELVKIAILCHMHHPISEPYEGGTEAHTAMLADALVARGHDVTLFAKEGSQSTATIYPLVPKDFEFTRIATPLVRRQQHGFLAEAVHHSIEVIRESDFDAVINNSLSSLPFRFMDDCVMMTVLHTPPTLPDVNAVLVDPGWTPSPRHAWVTVSDANATAWRKLLPAVKTVHNGIQLDHWSSTTAPIPGLAVWAARITPEKGLHLAIDAARQAGMQFEFAGPISHSDYYADEIAPRLGRDVRYRGHLGHSELRRLMSSGSVFVASPLWAEPFGLSVVEALAAGTPVAAFANGAMPEIVTAANGALARETTVKSLAGAIRTASLRDRRATLQSSKRFDFETMIDGYERVLRTLVTHAAPPVETTSGSLIETSGGALSIVLGQLRTPRRPVTSP
jgi:glycosyltransferase involved in cell wall biosynthesis